MAKKSWKDNPSIDEIREEATIVSIKGFKIHDSIVYKERLGYIKELLPKNKVKIRVQKKSFFSIKKKTNKIVNISELTEKPFKQGDIFQKKNSKERILIYSLATVYYNYYNLIKNTDLKTKGSGHFSHKQIKKNYIFKKNVKL